MSQTGSAFPDLAETAGIRQLLLEKLEAPMQRGGPARKVFLSPRPVPGDVEGQRAGGSQKARLQGQQPDRGMDALQGILAPEAGDGAGRDQHGPERTEGETRENYLETEPGEAGRGYSAG